MIERIRSLSKRIQRQEGRLVQAIRRRPQKHLPEKKPSRQKPNARHPYGKRCSPQHKPGAIDQRERR